MCWLLHDSSLHGPLKCTDCACVFFSITASAADAHNWFLTPITRPHSPVMNTRTGIMHESASGGGTLTRRCYQRSHTLPVLDMVWRHCAIVMSQLCDVASVAAPHQRRLSAAQCGQELLITQPCWTNTSTFLIIYRKPACIIHTLHA